MAEIGLYALRLAFFAALVGVVSGVVGGSKRRADWARVARRAVWVTLLFTGLAAGALLWCLATGDYSLAYVARHSARSMTLPYRLSALWGGQGGSLLLWVLISLIYASAAAWIHRDSQRRLMPWVNATLLLNALFFLALINWVPNVNPFDRLPPDQVLSDGQGLNPLLQHPLMIIHPVMLYSGFTGFSVPFAFGVAALVTGRLGDAWLRATRRWTLVPWFFLSAGILLGGRWAYEVLGWGGYWAWDPVENASFMPWLLGTALIHSAIVVEKRDTLKSWTILLAILTFSLSLVGTFLVRSGVLTSVHSFASDPSRGMFILGLLVVAVGGSLTLFAWRAPALKGGGLFAPISREGALILNNLLLSCGCATVFLGTLYPLFLDAMGGPKLSVGFPFFTATFVPLMVPLVVAVGIGPLLAWKRADLLAAMQRLWVALTAAVLTILVVFSMTSGGPVLAILGLGLAAWLGVATLLELAERLRLFRIPVADSLRRAVNLPRSAYGMTLAHFGLAVSVAGFAASAFDREAIEILRPGQSLTLAGYEIRLEKVTRVQGANYVADDATVRVLRDGVPIAELHPQRRFFPVQRQTTSDTSIRTNLLSDFYVALGEADGAGAWTIRAYWKPLVPWIWLGAVIMALGGLVSLTDRRWRVGAAARARGGSSPQVAPPASPPAAAE